MQKLVIEVRVNEYAMRDENPNVPWTPEEIAADAAACEAEGASIVHFHARKADGSPAHDTETYAEVIRRIRDRSAVLLHPTLGQITVAGTESRLRHIKDLAADAALRPELASVDLGSTNIDRYDAARRAFRSTDGSYVNTVGTLVSFLRTFAELGVRPAVACWAVPFVRTLEPFFDMGLLPTPTWVILVHTGDGVMAGHPPTPAGLRAFLDFLPADRPIAWTVASKPGNLFANAAQAIQLGGHVSIGIGDHDYAELGAPTNAELVRRVVHLARSMGREVATPAETRALLELS
ncbi:MAG: 3-keto-5-aminohexanoate cleavage protein [Pseudomonadota bacterium]